MESKHTKGEWKISKYTALTIEVDNRTIATTGGYQSSHNSEKLYEENIANAKLIAAAPELLEALVQAFNLCDKINFPTESELREFKEKAKIIIEKATK